MKNGKLNNLRKIFFSPTFWGIITLLICSIVFLPHIGAFYNWAIFSTKVDSSIFHVSRLELLKIYLSLIGPALTFLVFRNTLYLQDESRKKYKEDKLATIQRKNIDDANREFFILLQLFAKQQETVQNNDVINNLYYKSIFNDEGYGFVNYYHHEPDGETTDDEPIVIKRSKGPFFGEATCYKPKSNATLEEISLEIINEQIDSVQAYIGPYLKLLYQILKSLNNRYENGDLPFDYYINFIELLTSHMSSEEFIIILFSSVHIERCLKLGVELVGTNFFGDRLDFERSQNFEVPSGRLDISDMLIFEASEANIKKRRELRKRMYSTDAFNLNTLMSAENYCSII